MLKFTEEYAKRVFEGNSHKEAYTKAMKWIATNIVADSELNDTIIHIEKSYGEKTQLPEIIVHLSVCLTEKEHRERHCKVCKEVHSSFLLNEETNCAWCKALGYQRRLDEFIKFKKSYCKERLGKKL